jgi:hypothetical protein
MRLGNGDEDKDCKVHSIDIFYLTSFVEREKNAFTAIRLLPAQAQSAF